MQAYCDAQRKVLVAIMQSSVGIVRNGKVGDSQTTELIRLTSVLPSVFSDHLLCRVLGQCVARFCASALDPNVPAVKMGEETSGET